MNIVVGEIDGREEAESTEIIIVNFTDAKKRRERISRVKFENACLRIALEWQREERGALLVIDRNEESGPKNKVQKNRRKEENAK